MPISIVIIVVVVITIIVSNRSANKGGRDCCVHSMSCRQKYGNHRIHFQCRARFRESLCRPPFEEWCPLWPSPCRWDLLPPGFRPMQTYLHAMPVSQTSIKKFLWERVTNTGKYAYRRVSAIFRPAWRQIEINIEMALTPQSTLDAHTLKAGLSASLRA